MVNWGHTNDQQAAQIDNFLEFLWVIMPSRNKKDIYYRLLKN